LKYNIKAKVDWRKRDFQITERLKERDRKKEEKRKGKKEQEKESVRVGVFVKK
jgi:hypothetical protein